MFSGHKGVAIIYEIEVTSELEVINYLHSMDKCWHRQTFSKFTALKVQFLGAPFFVVERNLLFTNRLCDEVDSDFLIRAQKNSIK